MSNGGRQRPSLRDVPSFAESSFVRSLLDGGDYSHLLYDDQNDAVAPERRIQTSNSDRSHDSGNSRQDNRHRTDERNRTMGQNFRAQSVNSHNSSTWSDTSEQNRRHSAIPYSAELDRHTFERISNNVREQPLVGRPRERFTPHEGLPPPLLPPMEQPESKSRPRCPDCLKVGNALAIPLNKNGIDHRLQRIKKCKECNESFKVSKFHSLAVCQRCTNVMHNESR